MTSPKRRGSAKAQNKMARLLAVQCLYKHKFDPQTPDQTIYEFMDHWKDQRVDDQLLVSPDPDLFAKIVRGVLDQQDDLRETVTSTLGDQVGFKKLDHLLAAIILAGTYEILHQSTDVGIIINDYLTITHSFYDANEHKIVNAALDKIGKVAR